MSDQMPESGLDDEFSLRPFVEAVWRRRQVILLVLTTAAVLFAILGGVAYVVLPKERLGTIQFRLLFNGADVGRYPNGTAFNPTEIVASTVLSEVFGANGLERYATLQDFQQGLFVLQSNPALQGLDRNYQAKLSDSRLTPVDRAKLEDEFTKKREALRDPEFSLNFLRGERFAEIPAPLMEKVISHTLETWAKQADEQKGAARPDVDLVSREVFARAALDSESFLVRTDVLRSGAQRIIKALTALQGVPGARAVRTPENSTLADELAVVEGTLKFDIEPLIGLARIGGGQRDRLVLRAYISNQIGSYRLDLRAATARAQYFQTSLREYMAQRGGRVDTVGAGTNASTPPAGSTPTPIMSQLSDSFIDRLMEMSAATQEAEAEYRRGLTNKFIEASEQAAAAEREIGYYEDLLKQLTTPSTSPSEVVGADFLTARFDRVLKALNESVDRTHKLYDVVAAQTMNPGRRLYQVTQPFRLTTTSAISQRAIAVAFVVTMLITLVGSVITILVRHSYRQGAESPLPATQARLAADDKQNRLAAESPARLT